ncbi:MAG: efflux RND transporter periplasmic adaptor subunit [Rhodospirillales bacterium]|nr:efflux RND transporter periplasmic adaptor subunit [Rhodospirillales bacterium]
MGKSNRRPGFQASFIGVLALAFATGLLASAPFASAAETKKPTEPPMQVGIDAIISQPLNQTVPVIGRFVSRQAGKVAARTSGPVGIVHVEVGDRVQAGDIIAELVSDLLKWQLELQKAEVRQQAAALITRTARAKLRHQELKRLERLKKSAAFSQARMEDKRQELAVADSETAEAEALVARASANMKLTATNLSYAKVRAPFSGVISSRFIEVGAYVKIGDPLVTIIDDNHLEIEADVPTNRIAGLTPSLQVDAFVNGTTPMTATVRAVVPDENPQTRTRAVRFVAQLPQGLKNIANNQSVTLHLPANSQTNAVTVHKDAILSRKGKTLVYLAFDGKADIRPVSLGEAVGSRFIVLGGLVPGDLVVVRGNERLRPGQPIDYASPKNKS